MLEQIDKPTEQTATESSRVSRRALLIGGGVTAIGAIAYPIVQRRRQRRPVFIARHQRYDGPLVQTIRDGLLATGFDPERIRGGKVLLKPNLVEPQRGLPQMTTHPSVVVAAAEVFRGYGANVVVGEAPGHVRDTDMALVESRLGPALDDAGIEFADLNYEESRWTPNRGGISKLDGLWLPKSVAEADLVVSLPKMKTHHWVGFTAALKNMYGVLPGLRYGWPKNVLHYAGIPQTVVDINASLPNVITIVDGIECMEGDGPILGSSKWMGLVLVGMNPTAVDATIARIMGLAPQRIEYLQLAAGRLGPVDPRLIEQRGESWRELVSPFKVLDRPHLRGLLVDNVKVS